MGFNCFVLIKVLNGEYVVICVIKCGNVEISDGNK